MSQKSPQVLFMIMDDLGSEHNLQFGTLSKPTGDSVLTTLGVDLGSDATPASFTAVLSTIFLLYDRQGVLLLEDPIILIFSQQRYV